MSGKELRLLLSKGFLSLIRAVMKAAKKLKKLISSMAKHEAAADFVEAFEDQEAFRLMLRSDIEKASEFLSGRWDAIRVTAKGVRVLVDGLLATKLGSPSKPNGGVSTDGSSAEDVMVVVEKVEPLEGADVMDALINVRDEAVEARQFALVNREAVRKILKKLYKKTSSVANPQMLERLMDDTLLDELLDKLAEEALHRLVDYVDFVRTRHHRRPQLLRRPRSEEGCVEAGGG